MSTVDLTDKAFDLLNKAWEMGQDMGEVQEMTSHLMAEMNIAEETALRLIDSFVSSLDAIPFEK